MVAGGAGYGTLGVAGLGVVGAALGISWALGADIGNPPEVFSPKQKRRLKQRVSATDRNERASAEHASHLEKFGFSTAS